MLFDQHLLLQMLMLKAEGSYCCLWVLFVSSLIQQLNFIQSLYTMTSIA